jgi:hypothetical protein
MLTQREFAQLAAALDGMQAISIPGHGLFVSTHNVKALLWRWTEGQGEVPSDLPDIELATVEQLMLELQGRDTFRGILLYQQGDFKGVGKTGWRWRAAKSVPREEVPGIMREMADIVERGEDVPI